MSLIYYVFRDGGPNGPIVNGMEAASLEAAQAFADKHMEPGTTACAVDLGSMEYRYDATRLRVGWDYDL